MSDKKFKQAQVSGAVMWVVATLIIIFILIFFVSASSILSKFKKIDSVSSGNSVTWISVTNSFAFSHNSQNEVRIKKWLSGGQIEK